MPVAVTPVGPSTTAVPLPSQNLLEKGVANEERVVIGLAGRLGGVPTEEAVPAGRGVQSQGGVEREVAIIRTEDQLGVWEEGSPADDYVTST